MHTSGTSHISFMHIPRIIQISSIHSLRDYCILNHNILYFNQCSKANNANTKSILNTNISHWKSLCPHNTVIKENHQLWSQKPNLLSLLIQSIHNPKHIYELSSIMPNQTTKYFQTLAIVINYWHILASMIKSK